MADKGDIPDWLKPHYPDQFAIFLPAEEGHLLHLLLKLVSGHIGLVVAVGRDDPVVGFGGFIDDKVYPLLITGLADTYHR